MRNDLPVCPYCKSLMRPQTMLDNRISYVCVNSDCKAISPRADTFRTARARAKKRAGFLLEWFGRDEEPKQQGDYLCEYAFMSSFPNGNVNETPVMTFYNVQHWNPFDRLFSYEYQSGPYAFGQYIRILRWADFGATQREKISETEVSA